MSSSSWTDAGMTESSLAASLWSSLANSCAAGSGVGSWRGRSVESFSAIFCFFPWNFEWLPRSCSSICCHSTAASYRIEEEFCCTVADHQHTRRYHDASLVANSESALAQGACVRIIFRWRRIFCGLLALGRLLVVVLEVFGCRRAANEDGPSESKKGAWLFSFRWCNSAFDSSFHSPLVLFLTPVHFLRDAPIVLLSHTRRRCCRQRRQRRPDR